ncbi:MAG: 4Fe-4S binding protein [Treponema sp.]|jgi:NAD-dependent dihydropyrimidine dehydrogenase PreA subunit|nr:4Fe-4S binding protein [Treponema sp.]
MAHKILDTCINCGSCIGDCPVDAISEKDGTHVINPDSCSDCGACVGSCPTDAIVPE